MFAVFSVLQTFLVIIILKSFEWRFLNNRQKSLLKNFTGGPVKTALTKGFSALAALFSSLVGTVSFAAPKEDPSEKDNPEEKTVFESFGEGVGEVLTGA